MTETGSGAPPRHLTWTGGGHAAVIALSGDAVVLLSTISSPPGSRPEAALDASPPARVKVKVHGCRRQPDGTFRLDGRLVDATREVRAALAALAEPPGGAA